MSKYRIVKSVAYSSDFPFLLQRWNEEELTWKRIDTFSTLAKAKEVYQFYKQEDEDAYIEAEIVWEEEDV